MNRYSLVTSPLAINGCGLRNRIVRCAHGTGYASHGVTDRLIAFHLARARGGIGLTILETAGVHPSSPSALPAWDDAIIPGWTRLAEAVHAEGMKVFHQIWHGGAQVAPPGGAPSWSASDLPDPVRGRTPIAMTKPMIDEIVECFAQAARRAQQAGLDGVELHGGHTYLVSQFLSPLTNHRSDEYGGSLENRIRFAREILAAIRREVGRGYPVGIRISATEGVPGGIEPEEASRVAQLLERDGEIDFLDVSVGGYHHQDIIIGAMHEPHGYELPSTSQVTRAVSLPTIVTGRLLTLAEAERVLEDGVADLVSMVRATLADPDLVNKSIAGREADVRPCIGCNEGCLGQRKASGAAVGVVGCTVNPDAGFEYLPAAPPAPRRRRVVVIGAGPAGLAAARTAAARGHEVEVFESNGHVGGLLAAARAAPTRGEIGLAYDHLERELRRLEVPINLNTTADLGLIERLKPDVVITATGSSPRRDGVQRLRPGLRPAGLTLPHVSDPVDVLLGRIGPARHALVFDDIGHFPAISAAEHLLAHGVRVSYATSLPSIGPELVSSYQRDPAAARLSAHETFTLLTRMSLVEVTERHVTLTGLDSAQAHTVPADLVVLATAFASHQSLHRALEAAGVESHLAGDAVSPLLLAHAIASGHAAGLAV